MENNALSHAWECSVEEEIYITTFAVSLQMIGKWMRVVCGGNFTASAHH